MASNSDQFNLDNFRACVPDPLFQLYHLPRNATNQRQPDEKGIWLGCKMKSTFYSKSEAEDAEVMAREENGLILGVSYRTGSRRV
jgi:hypothetical protein